MLHGGNDVTEADNRAIRRTKKADGVLEHSKQFKKYFLPGENIVRDESTVCFKGKTIWKTYNPKKPIKWGIRLFILVDSDAGYVHSIIRY
jgi:hypothetical protein